MKGIDGLGHYAAMTVRDALDVAIRGQERAIESCGLLTHQDAKQSPASREYFAGELERHKAAIDDLHRFRAEVSGRAWEAYRQSTSNPSTQESAE